MSLSVRWHCLEAATWVHRLLVLWVVLLGLLTAVICIGGLMVGAPLMWILPAVMTALAGWIASAWGEGRRWSWWGVTALIALGAISDLLGLASGISWWEAARLVVEAAFLALLAHPDSTARLARQPDRRAAPRWVPDRPPSG